MNDPGLQDNIDEAGDTVRQELEPDDNVPETQRQENAITPTPNSNTNEREGEPETKLDHWSREQSAIYQPTLWWTTATAFPLIAGTFGPIANLFSICALVETWRVRKDNGERIPDPHWLTGVNATSLFLAVIANLVLLFNFARRIRYKIAQPITITLWYMACILLIICISLVHDNDIAAIRETGVTSYSQSYYYGIISSVLYFTIATLLLISSLGSVVFHAYPPTFSVLTGPQRTLMLQTTSFSLYLALGAGIFSKIEGWQFVDGIYWADYTLLTIGLGSDFPLYHILAKVLLIPYAALGITLVGLVVSSVRGLVLERAKAKVKRRHVGKLREKWRRNIEERQLMATKKRTDLDNHRFRDWLATMGGLRRRKTDQLMRMPRKLSKFAGVPLKPHSQKGAWHRTEFELMRFIEAHAERTERIRALFASLFVILLVWIVGSVIFWSCEREAQQWSYIDSFYFSYTTLLTIGYGDFYPSTSAGKPFFVIWSLISVPAMTVLISNMGDTVVKGVQELTVRVSQWTILPERSEKTPSGKGPDNGDPEVQGHTSRSNTQGTITRNPPSTQRRTSSQSHASSVLETGVGYLGEKIGAFEESENRGGSLAARLAREISKLAKDLKEKPPKRYSWDEWSLWLDLLGERDGSDAGQDKIPGSSTPPRTATPELKPQGGSMHSLNTDRASASTQRSEHVSKSSNHWLPPSNRRRANTRQSGISESDSHLSSTSPSGQDDWKWTWLGDHGPLLSPLTETEWLIGKLCVRMEEVLEDEIREARLNKAHQ